MSGPKRNRVQPTGEIIATPTRGLFMGNRGRLPGGEQGTDRRQWGSRTWLVCDLAFGGKSRANTGRARYTKLFFLDEAVAFAAGHRPCAFCRREAYNLYRKAWRGDDRLLPSAADMNDRLHGERIEPVTGQQKRHFARLRDLPPAAFVLSPEAGEPALLTEDALVLYTPTGYGPHLSRRMFAEVEVLTPPATLAVLRAGYRPALHPSIGLGGTGP